jgi:hypothetical protein
MATNANWTVVFDDYVIQKNVGDGAGGGYSIMMLLFGLNLNFQIYGLFNIKPKLLQMK